jgi:hypothetical protein
LPPAPPDAPTARRDTLLSKLEGYHEQLVEAAESEEVERVDDLLATRQAVIDELTTLADRAPIPPELGKTIAEREAWLQELIGRQLATTRGSMGETALRGKAAMRYRRSR